MSDTSRPQKRIRLAELDPTLDPSLQEDEDVTFDIPSSAGLIPSPFHLPNHDPTTFDPQFHWPAEPSSNGNGLAGISIPPLPNMYDEPSLHSAVQVQTRSLAPTPSTSKLTPHDQAQMSLSTAGTSGYLDDNGTEDVGDGDKSHEIPDIHVQGAGGSEEGSENGNNNEGSSTKVTQFSRTPELKVHHKLAERQRRKEMKDLFEDLRAMLPTERDKETDKKASKWEILKKAIEYIDSLKQSNGAYAGENERLRRELEMSNGESVMASYGGHTDELGVENGTEEMGQEAIVAALRSSAETGDTGAEVTMQNHA